MSVQAATVFDAGPQAMAIVEVEDPGRYGSVSVQDGRVTGFEEKRAGAAPGWINAGLYHLRADSFRAWDGKPFSIERAMFPRLTAERELKAVPLRTEFIDIGIPEDYRRFSEWIVSGKGRKL